MFDLYRRAAGGGGADELLFESPERKVPTDVSSDGKLLLFDRDMGPQRKLDVWALPLTGGRPSTSGSGPFPVVSTEFDEGKAAFSPDGRWIAYESDGSEIYIQPFPTTGVRVRVSTTRSLDPQWSADGKQIFFRTWDNTLMVVDTNTPTRPGVPKALFTQSGPWTADPAGQRFLFAVEGTANAPITVVVNWAAGLGRR